jgi:hypothetical protein
MDSLQVWLVAALATVKPVALAMRTRWGWPAAESIHFIGLSLLVGCIGLFDLRLLGIGKRIPIAALHRLIPWGLAGYGINMVSGAMFLMTEPDQYIYNPAFHFKLLFMGLAGFNALAFYVTTYQRTIDGDRGSRPEVPRSAKVIAAISLCLWIGVIVCGRLLTFYRPGPCGAAGPGFLAECIPRSPRS